MRYINNYEKFNEGKLTNTLLGVLMSLNVVNASPIKNDIDTTFFKNLEVRQRLNLKDIVEKPMYQVDPIYFNDNIGPFLEENRDKIVFDIRKVINLGINDPLCDEALFILKDSLFKKGGLFDGYGDLNTRITKDKSNINKLILILSKICKKYGDPNYDEIGSFISWQGNEIEKFPSIHELNNDIDYLVRIGVNYKTPTESDFNNERIYQSMIMILILSFFLIIAEIINYLTNFGINYQKNKTKIKDIISDLSTKGYTFTNDTMTFKLRQVNGESPSFEELIKGPLCVYFTTDFKNSNLCYLTPKIKDSYQDGYSNQDFKDYFSNFRFNLDDNTKDLVDNISNFIEQFESKVVSL